MLQSGGISVSKTYLFFFSFSKACVTNPTAAGRFLAAGRFTGLPLIFLHRTGAVQN
jgi:hypothetical protein